MGPIPTMMATLTMKVEFFRNEMQVYYFCLTNWSKLGSPLMTSFFAHHVLPFYAYDEGL